MSRKAKWRRGSTAAGTRGELGRCRDALAALRDAQSLPHLVAHAVGVADQLLPALERQPAHAQATRNAAATLAHALQWLEAALHLPREGAHASLWDVAVANALQGLGAAQAQADVAAALARQWGRGGRPASVAPAVVRALAGLPHDASSAAVADAVRAATGIEVDPRTVRRIKRAAAR